MKKMKMVDGVLHFIVDDLGVLHLASCLILVFFIQLQGFVFVLEEDEDW